MTNRYWLTPTARNHIRLAIQETRKNWGSQQALKYRHALQAGLQYIADNHRTFHSPHRDALAAGTTFRLHLMEHRYVAFQKHDDNTIIIIGVFHESMDIPSQLKELRNMAQHEIEALKLVL